jgi:hypothetical protein
MSSLETRLPSLYFEKGWGMILPTRSQLQYIPALCDNTHLMAAYVAVNAGYSMMALGCLALDIYHGHDPTVRTGE